MGGGEKLFLDLADALARVGAEVRVATSNSGGITGKHSHKGVDIYSYKWFSLFGHPTPRKSDLRKHVEWADIVQTAQYTAAPNALAVAKEYGKPCVFMSYEYLGPKWYTVDNPIRATIFRLFERWVFMKPYVHYISISEASQRDLLGGGISESRASVIYPVFNNFDVWRPRKSKPRAAKEFLYYGRPGKTKGIFTLLGAVHLLDRELPQDISFVFIVSNDPLAEKKRLKQLVSQYGLNNRILINDSLPEDELVARIGSAYCVIVPSLTEGFGYSAYQAARMRKNLIVSNAGSLPEVISGRCVVFNKGDEASLADAIRTAVKGEFTNYPDRVGGDNTHKVIELYKRLIR